MTYRFLSPSDELWTQRLATIQSDIYHEPSYVKAAAEHQGGEAMAFYAENGDGGFIAPLLSRQIPDHERIDVTTPYGYPAPSWSASNPEAHWQAFAQALQEAGVVSVFLRLHPLLPLPDVSHLEGFSGHSLVEHGPTVWLRRGVDSKTRWADTRSDHRSDIRRLQREGYHVTRHATADADAFRAFHTMYVETMDRVGADPFYYFSDAYFRRWQTDLSGHGEIAIVRDTGGNPAAAGLFTRSDRWMQYHLSGTAGAHRHLAPAKLMLHQMALNTHPPDCTSDPAILHLGGGLGAACDSLFEFKAGFSSDRATFHSLRLICDEAAYNDLTPDTADRPTQPSDDYFPAYRRPD
jgi:hypothetical protein